MSVAAIPTYAAEERIHGVVVHDPFRCLEDANSIEAQAWIADQKVRIQSYFVDGTNITPGRERVHDYLDVETVDQPARIGDRYFYRKRVKSAQAACIYTRDGVTGVERLLVDPSKKGASMSVGIHGVSFDGTMLAYHLRPGGADKVSVHFIDVEKELELADKIDLGYARGFTFATDKGGIYYSQDISPCTDYHEIRFHRFGSEDPDEVVYRRARSVSSKLKLTFDDAYLGAVYVTLENDLRTRELLIAKRTLPRLWRRVIAPSEESSLTFVSGGQLFAVNSQGGRNRELLGLCDGEWRVIIPEQEQAIQQVVIVGRNIVITRIRDWGMVTELWNMTGQYIGPVGIPENGTVVLRPTQGSKTLFCTYESFGTPVTTYEFSPDLGTLTTWHQQTHPRNVAPYYTESSCAVSKDGTNVPVMLVSKTPLVRERTTPALLTAYGGFGTSVTPQYSMLVSIMLDLGCVFALARIRGGGEFGQDWHESAKRAKRQNAFDDFIAAAQWLCSEGVTSPLRLAIFGGSNSGLLVAVALTQRPDLFAAVLCIAPLLDMIRYENFDRAARWADEYGSVAKPDEFHALLAYSPYHHVEESVDYPSTLFISGGRDDRCNPAHVRKMAARLQARDAQSHPVLVDYTAERGHSPALPLDVRVNSLVMRITFLCRELNIIFDGGHNG